jgi:hypothetical protein
MNKEQSPITSLIYNSVEMLLEIVRYYLNYNLHIDDVIDELKWVDFYNRIGAWQCAHGSTTKWIDWRPLLQIQ